MSKKRPKFLVFPSDLGKNHYQVRKNKLLLSGEVFTYNMYEQLDQIKSYKEIMDMSIDEGYKYIMAIKAKHKVLALQKYWGVNTYNVYKKMFKKFNIPVDENKGRRIVTKGETPINVMNNIRHTLTGIVPNPLPGIPIKLKSFDTVSQLTAQSNQETTIELTCKEETDKPTQNSQDQMFQRIQNIIEAKPFPTITMEEPVQQQSSIFTIKINGEFTGKETLDRIVNILTILNLDNEYKVYLKIKDIDSSSKLKSNTEYQGITLGREILDQLQNLNLLKENLYKIEFVIEEQ